MENYLFFIDEKNNSITTKSHELLCYEHRNYKKYCILASLNLIIHYHSITNAATTLKKCMWVKDQDTYIKWYGTSCPYGPSTEAVILVCGWKGWSGDFAVSTSDAFMITPLSLSVHLPRTFMRMDRWYLPSKGLDETLKGCHWSHDNSRIWRKTKLRALYRKSAWSEENVMNMVIEDMDGNKKLVKNCHYFLVLRRPVPQFHMEGIWLKLHQQSFVIGKILKTDQAWKEILHQQPCWK